MIWINILFALMLNSSNNIYSDNNITNISHEIRAKSGDGVISLLRRYKLNNHQSNVKQFYTLNGISEKSSLIKGRNYKMPITIYKYDGKSIRTTIGIDDWDKAKRIKTYNEYLLHKGLRATHYTQSNILWVPYHELTKEQEKKVISDSRIKSTTNSTFTDNKIIKCDLFGRKYAETEVLDNKLKNRVYYLISGHGGPDPGAVCEDCSSTLCEDEYAYDVTLRLARNLMQHGATVEMIIQDKNDGIRDSKYLKCDKDERMSNGDKLYLNNVKRLNQRSFEVNRLYKKYQSKGVKEQTMVVIHVDSRSKSQRQDVFFNYYPKSKSSKQLALDVMQTFEDKYAMHQKGRNYKGYVNARNLHVLRITQPKGVFIELANIRNPYDHKRILLNENRQALANWIYEGITKKVTPKSDQIIASSQL